MRDGRPDPDPSVLTTENLQREIAAVKELFHGSTAAEVRVIITRIEGIEKAIEKAADDYTRVPTLLDREVSQLRLLIDERFRQVGAAFISYAELRNEKFESVEQQLASMEKLTSEQFHSIQQQFTERDVRTEQTSRDSKVAVDAALQAAKEAVAEQNRSSALAIAKSEAATDKRIDQIVALVSTATSALDGKIVDIKDRLVRIEGQSIGQIDVRAAQHMSSGLVVSIIAAVISFIGVAVAVGAYIHALGGNR